MGVGVLLCCESQSPRVCYYNLLGEGGVGCQCYMPFAAVGSLTGHAADPCDDQVGCQWSGGSPLSEVVRQGMLLRSIVCRQGWQPAVTQWFPR